MTEATIRNSTLIVPRTICNGPVMLFLPRPPCGVGSAHPPSGDGAHSGCASPARPGGVGVRVPCGRRCAHVGTIAGARPGYPLVTQSLVRCCDTPVALRVCAVLRNEHYR